MKDLSPRSFDSLKEETPVPLPVPGYLASKPVQENSILRLWYRVASPPMPPNTATFEEMERFRRGRAGSQIILALYFLLIISIPAAYVGTNIYLVPIVIGSSIALIGATVLNRLGRVSLAGAIVVLTFVAFPTVNIVTTPGGVSMMVLPLYGLLVLPLMCAVSFLPPWWVFVVAFVNCLFTWYSLNYLHRTAELIAILAIAFAGILIPIILSQIIVSVVAYAWVQGTTQALMRANRAEELARLEHDLSFQSKEVAQQKRYLESSIQKIVETHMQVANGNLNARVPLVEGNVLWQISGPLNNLLARAQRWRQDADQLQVVQRALQKAHEENMQLRRMVERNSR
ncbi:MAG TPA: hypothetical protein VGN34_17370 [Ktedonobacteraceae bacterium]|jgi:hypothetical protein